MSRITVTVPDGPECFVGDRSCKFLEDIEVDHYTPEYEQYLHCRLFNNLINQSLEKCDECKERSKS